MGRDPPQTKWSGDPRIAEEARRWQDAQRRELGRRGGGGWPEVLALGAIIVAWLAVCGAVAALSLDIATAPDGGEVLFLAPPVYVILAAVGTGLVVDVRSRIIGHGPPVGLIARSVIWGATLGSVLGTGLAFGLAAVFMALIGDDATSSSTSAAWWWATAFLVFLLPVIAGVGGVLASLAALSRPQPRGGAA